MKQLHSLIIALLLIAGVLHAATRAPHKAKHSSSCPHHHPQNQKEKYDPTPAVLTHFAHVVGGFINIIQDPHNPDHVGGNVANMLGHMVNIAVEATRRGDLPPNATQEDIAHFIENLDDELINELVAIAMSQTKTLAIPQISTK